MSKLLTLPNNAINYANQLEGVKSFVKTVKGASRVASSDNSRKNRVKFLTKGRTMSLHKFINEVLFDFAIYNDIKTEVYLVYPSDNRNLNIGLAYNAKNDNEVFLVKTPLYMIFGNSNKQKVRKIIFKPKVESSEVEITFISDNKISKTVFGKTSRVNKGIYIKNELSKYIPVINKLKLNKLVFMG